MKSFFLDKDHSHFRFFPIERNAEKSLKCISD